MFCTVAMLLENIGTPKKDIKSQVGFIKRFKNNYHYNFIEKKKKNFFLIGKTIDL